MQDIIHLLPDSLANQIAAGEVVQRPASVVKELLENAVDAQSTEIKLYIKDAGKTLIQVIDNGSGMSETDLRLSIERHTTSKINNSEDLYNIITFGFRGEALASICAVAQVDIKSRVEDYDLGSHLMVEASKVIDQVPLSIPRGTTISVKNLFFNVPARRKFLKSDKVELRHVVDDFQRVALANPHIAMALYQDETLLYNLPAGNLGKRILAIFGKHYKAHLVPCSEEVQNIKLKGYIGKPEVAKKTRGAQFFFINDRFIKHNYLNHAVINAYQDILPEDKYPFYVIFIYMDPGSIDINIHPTKMEVKFEDERSLYVILQAMLKRVLSSQGITPPIDFETDTNYLNQYKSDSKLTYSKPQQDKSKAEDWKRLFDHNNQPASKDTITFESEMDNDSDSKRAEQPSERKVILIYNNFMFYQVKSGLMVVNRAAALERIFYDRFLARLNSANPQSQPVMFSKTLILNPIDVKILQDFKPALKKIGFQLDFKSDKQIVIEARPAELEHFEEQELIEELIEQIKINEPLNLNLGKRLAYFLACQAAQQQNERRADLEIHTLIDLLFQTSNPYYTSEGKRIIKLLDSEILENWFSDQNSA